MSSIYYADAQPKAGKEHEAGAIALRIVELQDRRRRLEEQLTRVGSDTARAAEMTTAGQQCMRFMQRAAGHQMDASMFFVELKAVMATAEKFMYTPTPTDISARKKDIETEMVDVDRKLRLAKDELDTLMIARS
jgi:hypothetical protein